MERRDHVVGAAGTVLLVVERAQKMHIDGERLRAAREQAGLSQRQLAAAVGVNQQRISAWEKGKRHPLAGSLFRLMSVLDVDVMALLPQGAPETLWVLRQRAKLTQAALAEKSGVPRTTWAALELGVFAVRPEQAGRLAGALKTTSAAVIAASAATREVADSVIAVELDEDVRVLLHGVARDEDTSINDILRRILRER